VSSLRLLAARQRRGACRARAVAQEFAYEDATTAPFRSISAPCAGLTASSVGPLKRRGKVRGGTTCQEKPGERGHSGEVLLCLTVMLSPVCEAPRSPRRNHDPSRIYGETYRCLSIPRDPAEFDRY